MTKTIAKLDAQTVEVTTTDNVDYDSFVADLKRQIDEANARIEQLKISQSSYDDLLVKEQENIKALQAEIDSVASPVNIIV